MKGEKDAAFIIPSMRRFTSSTTPNSSHRPMKCSASNDGQSQVWSVTSDWR